MSSYLTLLRNTVDPLLGLDRTRRMIRIEEILERVAEYNPEADLEFLRAAYVFSAKAHKGQVRKTGEPYLQHPLEVMNILATLQMDPATLATGLLHDTVEDCPGTTLDQIKDLFGEDVAKLVDGVTKIGQMEFSSQVEKQAENFKKIILATAQDIRVILVKLADRLHNMRTLAPLSEESQERIARETLDIYAPLANRLGIHWLKAELEDHAFRYLYPTEYQAIDRELRKKKRARDKYITEVVEIIREILTHRGIHAEVQGRVKNLFSIFNKMRSQGLDFHQVHDLIAFRIILDEVKDCYEVLGLIHSLWTPVPGRVKDYIALPKENMYQSLHTTVIGPSGERIEIQIRTREMHRFAEEGIAAHWGYKENRKIGEGDQTRFAWLRRLLEWRTEADDPQEFLDSVKFDLFPNEIYVFTPTGDVIALPKGSTPIDFAYRIHTDVGHQCVGARVNGAMVPLRYEMKSGDRVEIVTQKDHKPSRDWLKFAQTPTARAKIRTYLRREERERSVQLGRSILEKELRKHKLTLSKLEKQGIVAQVAEKVGSTTPEGLYAALAYGKLLVGPVTQHFLPEPKEGEAPPTVEHEGLAARLFRPRRASSSGVLIRGADDVLVRMARCCRPLPGEPVIGFITRGRGITVHRTDCSEVVHMEKERRIEVDWDETSREVKGIATITIYSEDMPGLLADVTKVIATLGGDMKKVKIDTTADKHANHTYDVEVRDIDQLRSMMKALEKVRGVLRVERVQS